MAQAAAGGGGERRAHSNAPAREDVPATRTRPMLRVPPVAPDTPDRPGALWRCVHRSGVRRHPARLRARRTCGCVAWPPYAPVPISKRSCRNDTDTIGVYSNQSKAEVQGILPFLFRYIVWCIFRSGGTP